MREKQQPSDVGRQPVEAGVTHEARQETQPASAGEVERMMEDQAGAAVDEAAKFVDADSPEEATALGEFKKDVDTLASQERREAQQESKAEKCQSALRDFEGFINKLKAFLDRKPDSAAPKADEMAKLTAEAGAKSIVDYDAEKSFGLSGQPSAQERARRMRDRAIEIKSGSRGQGLSSEESHPVFIIAKLEGMLDSMKQASALAQDGKKGQAENILNPLEYDVAALMDNKNVYLECSKAMEGVWDFVGREDRQDQYAERVRLESKLIQEQREGMTDKWAGIKYFKVGS